MRVAAIGDNCLDVYIEQDLLTVGGNALNVAVNWSRLGLDARYFGAVGDDHAGGAVRDGVAAVGLNEADIETLPGPTGVTLIQLVNNDREFLYEEFGVGLDWSPTDNLIDVVSSFNWVHVAGIPVEAGVIERLVARGARVSVDLSTYRNFAGLEGVEVIFASWDGPADSGAHDLAAEICAAGAAFAVIMCGEHGSLVRTGTETMITKAEAITPVDTCGAGDSFIAGYVKSHLQGAGPEISLVEGTANATRTCLHVGGFEQPSRPIPGWLREKYYKHVSNISA